MYAGVDGFRSSSIAAWVLLRKRLSSCGLVTAGTDDEMHSEVLMLPNPATRDMVGWLEYHWTFQVDAARCIIFLAELSLPGDMAIASWWT